MNFRHTEPVSIHSMFLHKILQYQADQWQYSLTLYEFCQFIRPVSFTELSSISIYGTMSGMDKGQFKN